MTIDPTEAPQSQDALRWRAAHRPQATRCAHLHGLRLLAVLRVAAPLAQALTVWIVTEFHAVVVHIGGVVTVLALEVAVAVLTLWRLRSNPHISEGELFLQAQLDIALYAAMLYFTGGTTNPFGPMFLLPVVIVAAALRPRWVWATAATTIVAYGVLRTHHIDIYRGDAPIPFYALYENGLVVSYLITAALLVFFCNRMLTTLRDGERASSDVRDAQMRDESAAAMAALGATCAHELGSPLSTIAITVSEMRRRGDIDASMQRDLLLVSEQVADCKRIISQLVNAGGARRAESATAVRVDRFIEAAVARTRALHAGASITIRFDGALPAPMIVGEETLAQALLTLLHNAAQMSPRSVAVTVAWHQDRLLVEVSDTGPGYPADVIKRLHGRRVDTGAAIGEPGLGLTPAAQTLERLGGQLEVWNKPEGGAHARIRIPMQSIAIDSGPAATAHAATNQ